MCMQKHCVKLRSFGYQRTSNWKFRQMSCWHVTNGWNHSNKNYTIQTHCWGIVTMKLQCCIAQTTTLLLNVRNFVSTSEKSQRNVTNGRYIMIASQLLWNIYIMHMIRPVGKHMLCQRYARKKIRYVVENSFSDGSARRLTFFVVMIYFKL